ncbi:DEKNAAC104066 [Brettanomyces naardenensis]|uniref:Ribonuclease H n=1 Tax=Brettanomyces naardenensis TaxID=13370 RepID=A0A448YPV9_BRENA|nr:DEKNAAC104066 [Brettanomyces naardenensis]
MVKYYAVRSGRSTGVFNDWSRTSSAVNGYSGAEFKSFKSMAEAQNFMNGGSEEASQGSYPGSSEPLGGSLGESFVGSLGGSSGGSSGFSSTYKAHTIYTDGASKNNQSRGRAVAGSGVYYGHNDPRNLAIPLEGERQTNQRAELTAVNKALDGILEDSDGDTKYDIATDSRYTIGSMTNWGEKWKTNGFTSSSGKPVENQDIIKSSLEKIDKINYNYGQKGWGKLEFKHVPGHAGVEGNEMADRLANEGARKA